MEFCSKEDYSKIYEILDNKGVVIIPTETVYGLLTKIDVDAINRLDNTKNRLGNKVYSVISSISNIKPYLTDESNKIIDKLYSLSITAILNLKDNSLLDSKTIGLRLTNDKFLLDLVNNYDQPLYLTSANISGNEPIKSIEEATKIFKDKVDLYVYGELDKSNIPTSVIDFTTKPFKVLRQGSVKLSDIKL